MFSYVSVNYPKCYEPSFSSDPLQLGLNSVACGFIQGPAAMESEILTFMMDHIIVCPVNTIAHIP